MTEFRDENTVASPASAPSDSAVDVITRSGEIISFVPSNPVEMEYLITKLAELVEEMPDTLLELNEARYTAERTWSRRRNTALAMHSKNMTVTAARALAEVEAMPELEALHNAKAAWHYAEDTAVALRSKLFALLNINKGVQAAYNSYGSGRR